MNNFLIVVHNFFSSEGKEIPILPIRFIKNAKDKSEALEKALEDIKRQFGNVEFGDIFICANEEFGVSFSDTGYQMNIYSNGVLQYEIPHELILDLNPTIN